jgi:L-threonylcarbamoyladenylate synthase
MSVKRPKILEVDPLDPDSAKMDEAAETLKNGGLVAFPTETVYGLAAAYNNFSAVEKLCKVKNRPKDKPFTVHISRIEMIEAPDCDITYIAARLIKRFWPGPLTIILKSKKNDETIAFRMPDCRIARDLIDRSDFPVVAPSANRAGNRSPKTAMDVLNDLDGDVDMIIDGGPTKIGVDSTIVDATCFPLRVLREGAIPVSSLTDAWIMD